MPEGYVSRVEHQAAIDRLDRADQELRKSMVETERVLRDEFTIAVKDVREDVADVRRYNVFQTKAILGAIAGTVFSGIVTFLVYASLHHFNL